MTFTESGPYAWKSAEGYTISRCLLLHDSVYIAWYAKQPIGDCHRARTDDDARRDRAWLNCVDACEVHYEAARFERKHKGA